MTFVTKLLITPSIIYNKIDAQTPCFYTNLHSIYSGLCS